jgi:hypothetical protein
MRSSPADTRRLEAFERLLRAQGFPTSLVLAGAQVPYDVLLAGLSDADEARQWQLELSFLPGMEEDLEGLSLLQCFVLLRGEAAPGAADELRRLIVRLNAKLPLIGFGWLDAERMACFRHVAMLPRDEASAGEVVVQLAWMTGYLLGVFAPAVESVAAGTHTADQALADNTFREVFQL